MAQSTPGPLHQRSGRVKAARKLARRGARAEQRLFLAEGAKALTEALAAPGGVVEVFATRGRERAVRRPAQGRRRGRDRLAPRRRRRRRARSAAAVTPQGVVAVCRFLDVAARPSVLDQAAPPRWSICADVRDPGNAGTVIRTADAVGRRRRGAGRHTAWTPTTTRPSGRRSAASGTCRSRWTPTRPRSVRRCAGGRLHRARRGRRRRDRPVRGRDAGLLAGGGLAVRQRGLGTARRARCAGRPPGVDPDPRPRREPQPLDRRGRLPLRQRPAAESPAPRASARRARPRPAGARHGRARRPGPARSARRRRSRRAGSPAPAPSGCPSKCGVEKNGEPGSCTSACLSPSVATQMTITSSAPLAGLGVEGVGPRVAEEHERLLPDLVDRVVLGPADLRHVRHPSGDPVDVLGAGWASHVESLGNESLSRRA